MKDRDLIFHPFHFIYIVLINKKIYYTYIPEYSYDRAIITKYKELLLQSELESKQIQQQKNTFFINHLILDIFLRVMFHLQEALS